MKEKHDHSFQKPCESNGQEGKKLISVTMMKAAWRLANHQALNTCKRLNRHYGKMEKLLRKT